MKMMTCKYKLYIDCTDSSVPLLQSPEMLHEIESLARGLCFSLSALPEVPDTRNAHVLVFLSTWTSVRAKDKYFIFYYFNTEICILCIGLLYIFYYFILPPLPIIPILN